MLVDSSLQPSEVHEITEHQNLLLHYGNYITLYLNIQNLQIYEAENLPDLLYPDKHSDIEGDNLS